MLSLLASELFGQENGEMSEKNGDWPEYHDIAAILAAANTPFSPAYVHGMMSGLLCTDIRTTQKRWEFFLSEHPSLAVIATDNESLNKLFMLMANHLEEAPGAMMMLLPEDEEALPVRLSALSAWCDGFLEGISLDNPGLQLPIVQEVLGDLAQIKEVMTNAKSSQENETSYAEIVEFIRVAVLVLQAECQPISQDGEDLLPIH